MPVKSIHLIFAAKIVLLLWGFLFYLIGSGFSVGLEPGTYISLIGAFIFLTFCSPLLGALIGLLSSRVAGALLLLCAVLAASIALFTRPDPQNLSVPVSWAIYLTLGPILTALAQFGIFVWERAKRAQIAQCHL